MRDEDFRRIHPLPLLQYPFLHHKRSWWKLCRRRCVFADYTKCTAGLCNYRVCRRSESSFNSLRRSWGGAYRNKRTYAIPQHDTFLCVQMWPTWPWTWWSWTCQVGGNGALCVLCTRPGLLLDIHNILRRWRRWSKTRPSRVVASGETGERRIWKDHFARPGSSK